MFPLPLALLLSKRNLSRSTRKLLLFILPFLLVLTLAGPIYAQAQLDIDGFYNQIQSTAAWWDELWRSTFLGVGGSSTSSVSQLFDVVMQIVRVIAACVLTVYLLTMFSVLARDGWPAIQFMLRGLLVIALISYLFLGNGSNFGSIAYAGKVLFNQVNAAMMRATINGISITNALTDQIVSNQSKAVLEREIKICDAMPNPAVKLPQALSGNFPLNEQDPELSPDQLAAVRRLNCYYQVTQIANQMRDQAARQQCWGIPGVNYACAKTARFLQGFYDDMTKTLGNEFTKLREGKVPSVDNLAPAAIFRNYVLGNTAIALFQGIMYSLQYFFANLQELILFLWALTAPVMAAYSIFPNSSIGGLLQWGVTYISVIMCQVYYLMIVAIFASLIQTSETSMLSDILFPLVIGLGAWVIAAGLAAGGAIIAVRSLVNAGVTSIVTVGSMGAMVAGPIGGAARAGAAAVSAARGASRSRLPAGRR